MAREYLGIEQGIGSVDLADRYLGAQTRAFFETTGVAIADDNAP